MSFHICGLLAIAAFATATVTNHPRAANLFTLVPHLGGDVGPSGVVADANSNLFGTETGQVFEIVKTAMGYASTPTFLASFDVEHGGPHLSPLVIDSSGDLFFQLAGNDGEGGTVYEIRKTARGYASTPRMVARYLGFRQPDSPVVLDKTGNIFGGTFHVSAYLPHLSGTVYEVLKTSTGYAHPKTTLAKFPAASPENLIVDAGGNLFGTTDVGGAHGDGNVFEIVHTSTGYASAQTNLVGFDGANGNTPSGLILDAQGDLFGTTLAGGTGGDGTVFEIVKKPGGYARTPTVLANFDGADGSEPNGLIEDGAGDLFGVASFGGTHGNGTVYEIVKTSAGYVGSPKTLVNFCALAYCPDGANPFGPLIADANGNLIGTTVYGGTPVPSTGTVFEITNSGFVVPARFAGTPEKTGCVVTGDATLVKDYHGLDNAAAALGYPGIPALEKAILTYCGGV